MYILKSKKCEIQPTLINLRHNECSQKLHYYQFAVKLDKYVRIFNTLNDLSVPNEYVFQIKQKI